MATTLIISLWTLAVILIVVGVAGTVLPALPGVVFVFLGIFLAAWIDDFTTVSGLTVGICLAFTLLAIGLDYVAGMLGAKKVGASREAIVGLVHRHHCRRVLRPVGGCCSCRWWAPPLASTCTTAT